MKSLFFIVSLAMPLMSQADCFERYYTNEHLQKHPRQVVQSVILNYEPYFQVDSNDSAMELQVHMRTDGRDQLLHASALCQTIPSSHPLPHYDCHLRNGQGGFTVEFREDTNQFWPFGRSAFIRLKPGTLFDNKTYKSQGPSQLEVPSYDHTMLVHNNPLTDFHQQRCESQISLAHQVSASRLWNEINLLLVRNDLARPTVTARNLFHLSALQWDVHALYDGQPTYFSLDYPSLAAKNSELEQVSLHYASYTFLKERYRLAPGNTDDIFPEFGDEEPDLYIDSILERVLLRLGLRTQILDLPLEYQQAALIGIQVAETILASQKNDGSFEDNGYISTEPLALINPMIMDVAQSGLRAGVDYDSILQTLYDETQEYHYQPEIFDVEPHLGDTIADLINMDYWVRLNVPGAVDQSGNSQNREQSPLTLFWGHLPTFSDLEEHKSPQKPGVYFEDLLSLPTFADPSTREKMIRANLEVVQLSSMLNPYDMSAHDFDGDGQPDHNPAHHKMDISPKSSGNHSLGLNDGQGYGINPITGQAYEPYYVIKGDFYRSLAEFWADGPDSETPPGHWNTLANYVMDQMVEHNQNFQWLGQGPTLDQDDFERRLYLTLNGALHDAAVVAWGIKGAYQGNRPVMVIRKLAAMAEADPNFAQELVRMAPDHLKMVSYNKVIKKPGQVDQVVPVTKLAVKSWMGPWNGHYFGPESAMLELRDMSFQTRDQVAMDEFQFFFELGINGVGWILADNWVPYQRPSFTTPPFPGFISGHSTFSRAAAEVLTQVTGSAYFPGGLGTYPAPHLYFEYGPSEPFEFQWATYYDAADQSGISRIYGGIHANYDDLPARKIGSQVGSKAVERARQFFSK
jgi:hypothetical protein